MKKTIVLALTGLGLLLSTSLAGAQSQNGYFSGLNNYGAERVSPGGHELYAKNQNRPNINRLDNASHIDWTAIKRQLSHKKGAGIKIR